MTLFSKLNNFIGTKKTTYDGLTIESTSKRNKGLIKECQEIAFENHKKNGGNLQYFTIAGNWSDFLITCKKDNEIVGFVSLTKDFMKNGDLYVSQIAVKKQFQGQGIGTAMYDYMLKNFKSYVQFSTHVAKENIAFRKLLKNAGFAEYQVDSKRMLCVLESQNLKENTTKTELVK